MFTDKAPVFLNIIVYLAYIRLARSLIQTDKTVCTVNVNGQIVNKSMGEIWNSPKDLCLKHTCELGPNGIAVVSTFREYCYHTCYNDYDLVAKKGQCCGECIKKRCTFNNGTYKIGEMWKSEDQCTFYECSENKLPGGIAEAKVSSYQKSCAPINNCPSNRVRIKDCCQFCELDLRPADESEISDFVHAPNQYESAMSRSTYLKHPCRRECVKGAPQKVCEYIFVIEWYETLSKACFECPFNETDCDRPHCIYGDGSRRSVLVVNRMMPGPAIEVCKDDTIVVDVENKLMGESTVIHWHGLHQRETPHYDGVPQITQCPIPPHTTFRYIVKASNPGTHWWHSHIGMQRADGAFGALIIREPLNDLPQQIKNAFDYDSIDHVMVMQDWDHKSGVSGFNSFHHSIGTNKPKNILINGKGRYFAPNVNSVPQNITASSTTAPTMQSETAEASKKTFSVSQNHETKSGVEAHIETKHTPYDVFNIHKGFKYRFRTINSGFLNCPLEISVDNHTMDIMASDGHYLEPVTVDSFVSYAGERFDFIVNANQPVSNYWIRVKGLMDCDERFLKAHQGAILRYNGAEENLPDSLLTYDYHRSGFQLNALNRGSGHVDSVSIAEVTAIEPDTPELLKEHTDYKFYIYYDFYDKDFPHFNNPALYSIQAVSKAGDQFFGPQLNHITMKMPSTPLLIGREHNEETKFCNSSSLAERNINCLRDFCECTHVIQVPLNATVELVLIDEGYKYDANHPFHLHGHDFRVVSMERIQATGVTVEEIKRLDESNGIRRRLTGAPVKDTVTVPDGGYTIVRFLANNPGFWLLHCHIDFHVEVGMALVFKVGDYHQMTPIPANFPTCSNFKPQHGSQKPHENSERFGEPPSLAALNKIMSIHLLLVCVAATHRIFIILC